MRCIYVLKDPLTNSVVYVGETKNVAARFNQHKWGSNSDSEQKKEWIRSLKIIGLDPIIEIVDTAFNKKEALIKENNLIVKLINEKNFLFNVRNTKTLKQYDFNGNLICEFANAKLACKITGIIPRVDRHSAGGFIWSYDSFDKDIVYNKEESKKAKCKKVFQLDQQGNLIAIYDGVRIAGRETSIDHRSIAAVAAGSNIRKTAGGFYWKYN